MNQRTLMGIGLAAVVAIFLLIGSVFTVQQTQQALILQFGNPVRVIKDPGLAFKVPFIQNVEFYDKRILDLDAPSVELILGDQKRLVVDTFALYRIVDPLRFRQSAGNEVVFRARLEPILSSSLRSVLGEVSLFAVLSDTRTELMGRIRQQTNASLVQFGVDLIDLRIKRADFPPENSQAIFRRMQTEREREAKELRAQGAEMNQRIKARADRERRVLIAEAQKTSEITRGEGDAEAITISAAAFGKDVDFFSFYRSMQAYRESMTDSSTSVVLSPDSEFFRYFGKLEVPLAGAAGSGQPAVPPAAAPAASAPAAP